MIFNLFPFIVGYIVKINNKNFKISISKIFYFIIIGIFLIIISIIISNSFRTKQNIFSETKDQKNIISSKSEKFFNNQIKIKNASLITSNANNKTNSKIEDFINESLNNFYNLTMYRFIGIEGVMAVQSKKDKNLKLLKDALNEDYKENKLSFYDEKFLNDSSSYKDSISKISNQHAVTLPGFIAFCYYGNSKFLVFLFAFIISILCNLIVSMFQNCLKNPILSAFIANILAYRLIHWGYAPLNSYKLILALFLSLALIILVNHVLKKIYYGK